MTIGRMDEIQTEYPSIAWANGLVSAKGDKGRFDRKFVGFFVEEGKYGDLDAAMKQAGIQQVEIRHPRDNGDPIIKTHWDLGESLLFYPIIAGVPATSIFLCLNKRNQSRTVQSGIGLRWPQGGDSMIGVVGYIRPLLDVGYIEPVKIGARSRMVDYVIRALVDHLRVAKYADGAVNREKHPEPVGLYELALPLGPGEETTFGKTATSIVVPIVSQHPKELDRDYIASIYLADNEHGKEVKEKAAADWEDIKTWAAAFAANADDEVSNDRSDTNGKAASNGKESIEGVIESVDRSSEKVTKINLVDFEYEVVCFRDMISAAKVLDSGDAVRLSGKWKEDEKWGTSFIVSNIAVIEKPSMNGATGNASVDKIPF